jgi:hypothetical protein
MDLTTKTTYYYRVGELIAAVPSGYRPVFLGSYGYDLRSLLTDRL